MLGFFIKKNFFDGWDNILSLVVYNMICIALVLGMLFLGSQLTEVPIAFVAVLALFAFLLITMLLAINQTVAKFADFKYASLKETLAEIPHVAKDALIIALVFVALFYIVTVGIPFYIKMQSLVGVFFAALIFWFLCITVLALQWYFPIRAQLGNNFLKAIKKSYILFFDNVAFSIFLFLYTVFLVAFSCFVAFLVPGVSGVLLAWNNAFRLRLYKYDWMEAHPDIPLKKARRQIPWDELIADDIETMGPRTLKNLIFPWKD